MSTQPHADKHLPTEGSQHIIIHLAAPLPKAPPIPIPPPPPPRGLENGPGLQSPRGAHNKSGDLKIHQDPT